jgi:hypothetical protein
MGHWIAPGFRSADQVEAYLRMTFKPGVKFNESRYQEVDVLVSTFRNLLAKHPSKARKAFARYVQAAMGDAFGEGTYNQRLATAAPKNANKKYRGLSTDALRQALSEAAKAPVRQEDLAWLLDKYQIKPRRVEWSLSSTQLKDLAETHEQRLAERFAEDKAKRDAELPAKTRMSTLIDAQLAKGWDIEAAILGVRAHGVTRFDRAGLVSQLVKWDETWIVDASYLDELTAEVTEGLKELFAEDASSLLSGLKALKYISVGSLPPAKQLAIVEGLTADARFGKQAPARKVLEIQDAINAELKLRRNASARTAKARRCPICGQTPCARGSQCFNED